jgi:hypothetical protein
MSRRSPAIAALMGAITLASVSAQNTDIGGRGTGAGIGAKIAPGKTETTVTVKLGPVRTWKSVEGIEIAAELVSWPLTDPKAATADPATLKFDIVRNGQIRLRKNGKVSVLPLTRLSEADRAYVAALETATSKKAQKP